MESSTQPDLSMESALWQQGLHKVAGVDEVGRGCLAGPVISAAVLLPTNCDMIAGVRDSKKLSAKKRQALYPLIVEQAVAIGIGASSVKEIDQINILQSSYLSMLRALQRLPAYDHALIDGRDSKTVDLGAHTAVIKGDNHCYSIACAAIVAKVTRDKIMTALARHHPHYAWEKNMGYGTRAHLAGLQSASVTAHHRHSYAPIKAIMNQD